jgi:hypothetical protein
VWVDIVGGLLIAGAIAAWVTKEFWQAFFLHGNPAVANLWGPLIGPVCTDRCSEYLRIGGRRRSLASEVHRTATPITHPSIHIGHMYIMKPPRLRS